MRWIIGIMFSLACLSQNAFGWDRLHSPHPHLEQTLGMTIGNFEGRPLTLREICSSSYPVREAATRAAIERINRVPSDDTAFELLHAAFWVSQGQGLNGPECMRRAVTIVGRSNTEYYQQPWDRLICDLRSHVENVPILPAMRRVAEGLMNSVVHLHRAWLTPNPMEGESTGQAVLRQNASEITAALHSVGLTVEPADPPLLAMKFRVHDVQGNRMYVQFSMYGVQVTPLHSTTVTPTLNPLFLRRWGFETAPPIDATPTVSAGFYMDKDKMLEPQSGIRRVGSFLGAELGAQPVNTRLTFYNPGIRLHDYLDQHFSRMPFSAAERTIADLLRRYYGMSEKDETRWTLSQVVDHVLRVVPADRLPAPLHRLLTVHPEARNSQAIQAAFSELYARDLSDANDRHLLRRDALENSQRLCGNLPPSSAAGPPVPGFPILIRRPPPPQAADKTH